MSRFGFQPTLWLPPSPLGLRKELLVLREARVQMTYLPPGANPDHFRSGF